MNTTVSYFPPGSVWDVGGWWCDEAVALLAAVVLLTAIVMVRWGER